MHSIGFVITGTSWSNELIVNAGCAIRQKNTQNILLHDAQHLRHPYALIDTITLLFISSGRYVNFWGYRLLTGTKNIYLKES